MASGRESLPARLISQTCKINLQVWLMVSMVHAMSRKTIDSGVADVIDVVGDADVAEFVQAIGLLVRRVRAVTAAHELSWSEGMVLGRLAKDGSAATAELARAEAVKPQSMGATISALE